MMKKEKPFPVSEEALKERLSFLKDKDPSIIGKTCQMLSALKIVSPPPKQAYPFVVEVINSMRKDGKLPWDEKEWGSFDIETLDQFLPEIIENGEWVFSIRQYVKDKILNTLRVDARRKKRHVPLFIEREDENGSIGKIENPKLSKDIVPEMRYWKRQTSQIDRKKWFCSRA